MFVGLVQTYRAFAYNNAWANYRLLGACAELTQGDFEAERTSFFPSLQATLNHIYEIDLFYVDALEGNRHEASTSRSLSLRAIQPGMS